MGGHFRAGGLNIALIFTAYEKARSLEVTGIKFDQDQKKGPCNAEPFSINQLCFRCELHFTWENPSAGRVALAAVSDGNLAHLV